MATDDDAGRIHRELESALEAVREHGRASARVDRARAAEAPAREAVSGARAKLADEAADVRKLESFSPTRIWATLRGSRDTDLDREQAEQQAAEYEVALAEAWLSRCQEETRRAEAELAALGDVESRRKEALSAKEAWLRSVPGPAGEELARIAGDLADADAELAEVREAIRAGAAAAGALERARRTLESASGLATYDTFFGGGMLGDAAKYRRMDEAQGLLQAADQALRALSTELADVGVSAVVSDLAVDGLTETFDVWFDNIFTDWSVKDRISKALRRTTDAAAVVHEVRVRLAYRERDLGRRIEELGVERERSLT